GEIDWGQEEMIEDQPWFEYSGQSISEIVSLAEQYRTDSLVSAVEQAICQKLDSAGEAGLSDAENLVLAVEALEREVNNGGYSQFLSNSSKQFTPAIVPALERIGCPVTAAITRDAIAALKLPRPDAEPDFDTEDEARDEALDGCDQRFYQSGEDI